MTNCLGCCSTIPVIPLSGRIFCHPENLSGSMTAMFLEDEFRVSSWLTLNAGIRRRHLLRKHNGERHQSAIWRGGASAQTKLGFSGILRAFTRGERAVAHGVRAAAGILRVAGISDLFRCTGNETKSRSLEWRFRIGMDSGCRYVSHPGEQFLRSQQRGKFGHFLSADDRWSIDSRMGTDPALAKHRKAQRVYVTYSNQIAQGRGPSMAG